LLTLLNLFDNIPSNILRLRFKRTDLPILGALNFIGFDHALARFKLTLRDLGGSMSARGRISMPVSATLLSRTSLGILRTICPPMPNLAINDAEYSYFAFFDFGFFGLRLFDPSSI
jgi:hypothetical protein